MTDTASWSLLLGLVMPWLVAVVNRPWWPERSRRWVAIAASLLGGALVCLANGSFRDGSTLFSSCLTVLIASQVVYGHLFKGAVRKFEALTSGRREVTGSGDPAPESPPVYDDEPGAHSEDRARPRP